MEFSRKEYWSKFPVPFPGELFYPGMESRSPTLQADSLPSEPAGNSLMQWLHNVKEGWEPKNRYFWTNLSQPMLSSVQSVMSNSLPPHGLQHNRPPCPSPTLWSLLKLMSIKSVMPSNNLILYHPLLLSSIFPSIRVFSNESVLCIRWPKYCRFSFSVSPSNEYSGLIPLGLTGLISLQSKGLS